MGGDPPTINSNNNMSDEDSKRSLFNAGVALAERIDQLQRAINMARFNPLAIDNNLGIYNYQVMVYSNDGLLQESWAKLTEKEKLEGKRIKNLVHNFIETFPLIKEVEGKPVIINHNYKKFCILITLYENKNKIFLDEHNLNAPNMDDDDGL